MKPVFLVYLRTLVPIAESSEDSSLPPEDLDVVVDFYTRSLSEKKAAEEEATAPIAGGRGGGGNGNGTGGALFLPPKFPNFPLF